MQNLATLYKPYKPLTFLIILCHRSKNQLIEMLEAENRQVDESYKELIEEYHTNISVLSGRMEYHNHSFESLLENERKSLEAAYDQQKSQHLKKGEKCF